MKGSQFKPWCTWISWDLISPVSVAHLHQSLPGESTQLFLPWFMILLSFSREFFSSLYPCSPLPGILWLFCPGHEIPQKAEPPTTLVATIHQVKELQFQSASNEIRLLDVGNTPPTSQKQKLWIVTFNMPDCFDSKSWKAENDSVEGSLSLSHAKLFFGSRGNLGKWDWGKTTKSSGQHFTSQQVAQITFVSFLSFSSVLLSVNVKCCIQKCILNLHSRGSTARFRQDLCTLLPNRYLLLPQRNVTCSRRKNQVKSAATNVICNTDSYICY